MKCFRLFCYSAFACMFCLTVACVPTPDTAAVVSKADSVFEDQITTAQVQMATEKTSHETSNSVQNLNIPTHWSDELNLKNFQVTIDAAVTFPVAESYPVYIAHASSFQDETSKIGVILQALIKAPKGYRNEPATYEKYLNELQCLSLGHYDFDNHQYVSYTAEEAQEVNDRMAEINGLLSTAPHADEFQPFTGFVTAMDSEAAYLDGEGGTWNVAITEHSLCICKYDSSNAYEEIAFLNDQPEIGQPKPTPYPQITIDQGTAVSLAKEFLQAIGFADIAVASAERAALLKQYYNLITDEPTETQGYLVRFVRSVNGIPFLDLIKNGSERIHLEESDYTAPISPEQLQVFVNNDGICMFKWENPVAIDSCEVEDVTLLSFDNIREIALQMLKNGLSWSDERPGSINPTRQGIVDRIGLQYALLQRRNAPGEYYVAPVWVMDYCTQNTLSYREKGYIIYPYRFVFNAVDGTNITMR